MRDQIAEVQQLSFANGFTAYIARRSDGPTAMRFIVHAGSRQDPVALPGVAHLVEHLVSDHSAVKQSDIETFFNEHGSTVMLGEVHADSTQFACHVPSWIPTVTQSLSWFERMLIGARLYPRLQRERKVVLNEIASRADGFRGVVPQLLWEQVIGRGIGRVFQTSTAGTPEAVMAITQHDVQQYYEQYYVPANISLVVVGRLAVRSWQKMLEQSLFTQYVGGSRVSLPVRVEHIPAFSEPDHVTIPDDLDESRIVSYHQYARLPIQENRQATRLFSRLLSERLEREVRQQHGWAYGIGATIESQGLFDLLTIAAIGLHAQALPHLRAIVDKHLRQVCRDEQSFWRGKRALLGELQLFDASAADFCAYLGEQLAEQQRLITLVAQAEALDQVSLHDLQSFAQLISQSGWWRTITHT